MTNVRNPKANDIRNLVFSGGGGPGIWLYLGVLPVLNHLIKIQDIKRIAGTSIGAITALMLSLQFNQEDSEKFINKIIFKNLLDKSILPTRNIRDVLTYFGICEGNELFKVIQDIITTKKQDPAKLTFADLKKLTGVDLYVPVTHFYMQGSNPTATPIIFSPETTPDTVIAPIILASACLMPLFQGKRFTKKSETNYEFTPYNEDGLLLADGGYQLNYGLNLFDHPKYFIGRGAPHEAENFINYQTLGFVLENKLKSPQKEEAITQIKKGDWLNVFWAAMSGATIFRQTECLKIQANLERTVVIDRLNLPFYNIVIEENFKTKLRDSGKLAMEEFFNRKMPEFKSAEEIQKQISACRDFTKGYIATTRRLAFPSIAHEPCTLWFKPEKRVIEPQVENEGKSKTIKKFLKEGEEHFNEHDEPTMTVSQWCTLKN